MKIILTTLTILLSLTFAFGQTVAPKSETDWVKLAQAFRQVLKDAEGGFSAIRGKAEDDDEDSKTTDYEVTKNRFEAWSFDVELTYFKEEKAYQLTFDSYEKNAVPLAVIFKNLFQKELVNKFDDLYLSELLVDNQSELTFDGDTIGGFKYGKLNRLIFIPHPTAWKKINEYLAKKSDKELADLLARNNPAKTEKNATTKNTETSEEANVSESMRKMAEDVTKAFDFLKEDAGNNSQQTEKNSTTAQNPPTDQSKSTSDATDLVSMMINSFNCLNGNKESCNKLIEGSTRNIKADPKDASNFSFRGEGYLNSALILSEFLKPNKSDKTEKQAQADAKQAAEYTKLAQADFQKNLELNPAWSSAVLGLGITQFFLDQDDSAITNLTKYIEKVPDDKKAYQFRSLTYYSLKKYQLAINDADKALELNKTKYRNETEKKEFADYMTFFRGKYSKELEKAQKGGK